MHRHGHAGRPAGERGVDRGGVAAWQVIRVVAVAATGVAHPGVAQVGKGDVVELQVGAAGPGQLRDGDAIGGRDIGPELVEIRIDLGRDCIAPTAQMQHRG